MSRQTWVIAGLGALFLAAVISGPIVADQLGANNPELPRWARAAADTLPFAVMCVCAFLAGRMFRRPAE